jgi:hypothetical protein
MTAKSKTTQEKQSEKLVPGSILIMDIEAIPREHGLDMEQWAALINEQGLLLYDSTKGNAPAFEPENETIKVYDVSEEGVMKELEEELLNLEGPLKPIIAPKLKGKSKSRRHRVSDNLMSDPTENLITTDGDMIIGGTSIGSITLDSNFTAGDQLRTSGGTTFTVANGTGITINPISVPEMSDQEVQEFRTNWESAQVAIAQGEHTPTPIVYGTGGGGTLDIEENTVASVFDLGPQTVDDVSMEQIDHAMEVITGDDVGSLTRMESMMEDEPSNNIANRTGVAVVGSPLTDREIGQLGIEDPRGQDLLDSGPVTPSETAMIDAVMNAQPARPVRRRAPRQIEPGFNLTDDTE